MMPIIVSHYTENTPYEEVVRNLIVSLKRFGLDCEIEGIPTLGSWRENSNYCAVQVQSMMRKYPNRPILRVDADAVFQREPILLRNIKEDLGAVFWEQSRLRPAGELLGGTLFFNCTEKARQLVDEWVRRINKNPRARNSDVLQQLVKEHAYDVSVRWLPLEYCTIFDLMKSQVPEPIIEHFQASRKFKTLINMGGKSKMLSIDRLKKRVKSDVAVFLGSGQSINNITPEQWAAIQRADIWTVNNWVYHPTVVPDFYHVETKHYGFHILQRRFKQKWAAYRNVKFILPQNKTIKVPDVGAFPLRTVIPPDAQIFYYNLAFRDRKRTHKPFNADYKIHNTLLTKSYDMSVTLVLELMFRMGYRKIVTFGIDLNNSYYFWSSGDAKYGEVHHLTNKAHENKPPEEPHATQRIQDFIFDFNNRWMQPFGREILVGHEDTDLYPGLNSTDIRELVK